MVAVLLLCLSACTTAPAAAPQTPQTARMPEAASPVAVRVGDHKLTLDELDALASVELGKADLAHARKVEEVRRVAAREYIERRLLEAEAKRRGLAGPDALLAQAVYAAIESPTEEDARAFYERNTGELEGSYEDLRARIFEFLQSEAKDDAVAAFISDLWTASDARLDVPVARVHVAATGPSLGPADAPVTIVEFSDFQCPYCRASGEVIDQLRAAYPDEVRVVFRDYPLEFHDRAIPAAIAGHCADAQGKFWPMHDLLFEHQDALDDVSLRGYGERIDGLDVAAFTACLAKADRAQVDANIAAGDAAGVEGTPAFFINGMLVSGLLPFEDFKALIDAELAR